MTGFLFWFFEFRRLSMNSNCKYSFLASRKDPCRDSEGNKRLLNLEGNVKMKACPCKQRPNISSLETLMDDQSLLAYSAAGMNLHVAPT